MKKLFTLFAFLAMFLGAKAGMITVVDKEINYSDYTDISQVPFASWRGSASAFARLSIVDGCLHFESSEATDPSWDCQFFPIGGVDAEEGVTYTLHFKIKGDHDGNVSMLGFGQTPYGQFHITTDWVEGTVDYVATNSDGNILMQCGDWVGTWDIAYLKITHQEKEGKPVNWENILLNGDASQPWPNPNAQTVNNQYDGDGAQLVSAFGKEYGVNDNNPHAATIENGAFVCQTVAVNPPLTWAEEGEQWGQHHNAGDPMPDNEWQNQFWINFPRPLTDGEPVKLSFKYKASENARAATQDHRAPGDYLGGGKVNDINFTTEWQEFSKEFTAVEGAQSLAFNLGVDKQYEKEIKFYFDDLNLSVMVLEKGFFAAGINTDGGSTTYDFDEAVKFAEEPDPDDPDGKLYVGTVGVKGDKNSWVNQVMISTAYGNDKGYKAATVALSGRVKEGEWISYSPKAQSKIDLPAAGVWTITVAPSDGLMMFTQEEGDKPKDPVDITTNTEVLVIEAVDRDDTSSEAEGGEGQTWDNQFFIVANRVLKAGEKTVVEFDYVAEEEAKTTTSAQAMPGTWRGGAIGEVNFTTEEQHFAGDFEIPKTDANDVQSIAFDMAVIKKGIKYTVKNVKWYMKDDEDNANNQTLENLIDATGTNNFWVKIGAGTAPYMYGTDPSGITNVTAKKNSSAATYNIAGQKVNNNFKGIVVKDGKKFVNK